MSSLNDTKVETSFSEPRYLRPLNPTKDSFISPLQVWMVESAFGHALLSLGRQ